ncbi:MAG: acylphosphatase [Planctomycetaceae bacterium]|nr:acylphosphatase [Planctomycetaceae bacterium]|tara:strand:- start:256 stop:525 length:270 start_codon:yes stop_codon:yes gene_type:complete
MIRRDVIYRGRVQGVGFRWTTNHIAKNFDVNGTVENRTDGTVYLVVEGQLEEVDAFMLAIKGRMKNNIKDVSVTDSTSSGNFGDFRVNY